MKVVKISYLLSIVLLGVLCACKRQEDTSNRSYFAFDPEDRKVVLPVQLDDSVKVKLFFDSGSLSGYCECIILDTGVLSANPSLPLKHIWGTAPWGTAWSKRRVQATYYDSLHLRLKIGHTDFVYSVICAFPYKKYGNSNVSDGMFNIPQSDTTHVWELNFEDNYMEVHSADSYKFPENCRVFPINDTAYYPFCVTLPLKFRFPDGDTLTLHREFLIDTGAPEDIILLVNASEQKCLNRREDAVWLHFEHSYVRYYTATATLFDNLKMDSLRIYTLDYKNNVAHPYVIGLNFLKRFNVFFDMKHKRLGLQPFRNYQRLVNPLHRRFHYSAPKRKDGKFIVICVGDYKENFYKTAGLQVGDEIVAMDGIPYGEITEETAKRLRKLENLTVDIIRKGKPLTLHVKVDINEPVGD